MAIDDGGVDEFVQDDFISDYMDGLTEDPEYRLEEPVPNIVAGLLERFGGEYADVEFTGEDDDEYATTSNDGLDDSDARYVSFVRAEFEDGPTVEWEQEHYQMMGGGDLFKVDFTVSGEDASAVKPISDYLSQEAKKRELDPEAQRDALQTDVSGHSWDDIVLPDETEREIRQKVLGPFVYGEAFEHFSMEPPSGVMMEGNPGTGKTLLARVVASETDSAFYSVKGSDIMSKYVGGSENNVAQLFETADDAVNSADTAYESAIIFIDEADALLRERSDGSSDGGARNRVVTEFLDHLDGLVPYDDILVLGATNRIDQLDPAAMRPGRFEPLSIGAPDTTGRADILRIHTQDAPVADDVNYVELAEKTEGYVGADLDGVVQEAKFQAVQEYLPDSLDEDFDAEALAERLEDEDARITMDHFEAAVRRHEPTTGFDTGPEPGEGGFA